MLDIRFIRENPKIVQDAAKNKNIDVDISKLLDLDGKRVEVLRVVESIRKKRNDHASQLKKSKPTAEQIEQGKKIKAELNKAESDLSEIESQFNSLMQKIPNVPLQDVPIGKSEDENHVVKTWGEKPKFDFEPKTHWQIAEAKGWIDKERAARVTGSRFAYHRGDFVKLEWALMQFGIDKLSDEQFIKDVAGENNLNVSTKPFVPVLTPLMIRTDVYRAMDRLDPSDDRYKIDGDDLWLQGSAEHVLGSMYIGETFSEADLPVRLMAYATSFRREAGTYGKDTEGIFRMHQFNKLEMESLSSAEEGVNEHLLMVAIQERLMQELKLPYQLVMKCTADIGKPNARGVDIDVWLPGQDRYRETHTADYMTDYQARRLQTKVKSASGGTELVHSNDATVFSQRPLIAILENYQLADGNVVIPEVLRPYLGGKSVI